MPDNPMQPGQPSSPASPPQAGAGTVPGQPPFGSSPASMPVPNRGHEAAGLARLSVIIKLMEETIPLLGAGSEPGRDLIKALSTLSKHVSPGTVSPGIQQSAMEKLMLQQKQMGPQIAAIRAMSPQAAPQQAQQAPQQTPAA